MSRKKSALNPKTPYKPRNKARSGIKKTITIVKFCIAATILLIAVAITSVYYSNSSGSSVSAQLLQAQKLTSAGSYQEAIGIYLAIIDSDPNNYEVWLLLANCYRDAANLEAATSAFLRALELNPDAIDLYLELFKIYYTKGNTLASAGLIEMLMQRGLWDQFEAYIPSVPVASHPSGTYEEAISVFFECDDTAAYIVYNTGGQDPGYHSNRYDKPIMLEEGETVISVAAVNANGLMSPVVHYVYSVEIPEETSIQQLRELSAQIHQFMVDEDYANACKVLRSDSFLSVASFIPEEGFYYEKETIKQQRNGLGTALYAFDYDNGLMAIKGRFIYYGNWENGIKSGTGFWLSDVTYTGIEWVYYNLYKGQWENDRPNGAGEMLINRMDGLEADWEKHQGSYVSGVFSGTIEGQLGNQADNQYSFSVTDGKYNIITAPESFGDVKNALYYTQDWVHSVDDEVYQGLIIGVPGFQK